ncbi:MAG TPA: YfcE family phosphodiesterase [Pirellulales bacterium]|nr:YfcE family phosphodiesterase [Pirellulales bacterium]
MLLGVISDTHGHAANTRRAVQMLESLGVEAVLHCGDIGSPDIVPLLSAWPTYYVFGNVDGGSQTVELRKAIERAGQTCLGRIGSLELGGVKIAVLHGDDGRLLDQTIAEGGHGLVCHGHTHVPRWEKIGQTMVLNPGALYRADPHTIAVVELPQLRAEIIAV